VPHPNIVLAKGASGTVAFSGGYPPESPQKKEGLHPAMPPSMPDASHRELRRARTLPRGGCPSFGDRFHGRPVKILATRTAPPFRRPPDISDDSDGTTVELVAERSRRRLPQVRPSAVAGRVRR
jgi:hypothetical protein